MNGRTAAIARALTYIEENLKRTFKVEEAAAAAGLSVSRFQFIFKEEMGLSFGTFVRNRKLFHAARELTLTRRNLLDIALDYGYASHEAFTRAFKSYYRINPKQFRRNGLYSQVIRRQGFYRAPPYIEKITCGSYRALPESPDHRTKKRGPDSCILKGLLRVGFYQGDDRSPENSPFPSCLASVFRFLGEDYPWAMEEGHGMSWRRNTGNTYFMGVSGQAFGFLWRREWEETDADQMYIAHPNILIDRCFAAAGYSYHTLEQAGTIAYEEQCRRALCDSIDRGIPVLAFGVIGPPECCLIAGYSQRGRRVHGWNYFQDTPPYCDSITLDGEGYFMKENWTGGTSGIILIGERRKDRSIGDREILTWALQIARSRESFGYLSGTAAYSCWAESMEDDRAFKDQPLALMKQRFDKHNRAVGQIAENRWNASLVTGDMAKRHPPAATELMKASQCYLDQHDLMWQVWRAAGGNGHPDAHIKVVEPQVRSRICRIIREALELDIRASGYLEQALACMGG